MRIALAIFFHTLSRLGFLGAIVFAAAAYGLTRPETITAFNWLATGIFVLWVAGHLVGWSSPKIGIAPPILVILILFLGWSVTGLGYLNDWMAASDDDFPDLWYNLAFSFGSTTPAESFAAMFVTSALLGMFLIAIDMFRDDRWSRAVLLTLVVTGLGMVLFFFLQKTFGQPFLLRDMYGRRYLNFATYRYWGNAASFLNLMWPLPAAVAVHAMIRRRRGWSIWLAVALLVFAANFFNKSKAGGVLGVLGLLIFLPAAFVHAIRRGRFRITWRSVGLAIIPIVVLAASLIFAVPTERWERMLNRGVDNNARLIAYPHFLNILPDAGWTGFGPGSFGRAYLDYFEGDERMKKLPFWVAHEDYIQTVVEWGYVGALLWTALLVPPFFLLAIQVLRRQREARHENLFAYAFHWHEKLYVWLMNLPAPTDPLIVLAATISLLLTAIHAAADFPMQIASLQLYFLIWIALGWSLTGRKRRTSEVSKAAENFTP